MDNIFDLSGKVALVTGSSRGIGKSIAMRLAAQGATVIVNARSKPDEIARFYDEFPNSNRMEYYQADVSEESKVKEMINKIVKDHGSIDILVNNAGCVEKQPIITMQESAIDYMYAQNTKPAFFTVKASMRHMIRNRFGRIINMSSMAGVSGFALQSHYAAAKASLIGFSKSVASELGTKGITCNVVAPGIIEGSPLYDPDAEKEAVQRITLRRCGRAEDVANVVAFLASDASAYMTGQVLHVDGGMRL